MNNLKSNNKIKIGRTHQIFIYFIFLVLFFSGLAWAIVHYFLFQESNFMILPHPLEPLWLKIHGAAAMASLILIGSLIPKHINIAWKAKKNRLWGATFIIILGFLILSGYLLYYSGIECLRKWTSDFHLWVGIAFPIIMVIHIWRGKKSMKKI